MNNVTGRPPLEPFPPYSYALYGAGTELVLICVMSILLNVLCLVGTRNLARFVRTNVTYLLLRMICYVSITCFVSEFIAITFAFMNVDFDHFKILYQILGAIMLHSYFFAIVASMTITFHRILVVAFPDYSNKLITERFVKCYLLVYVILYLLCIASSLTPIMGAYFKPGKLNWGLDHAKPYSDTVIGTMNIISNYIIGYVNMVVYTVLLAYLFMTKRISFQTATEKRMTIQVALMIIFEFGFYVGFELLNRGDTTGTESLIAQNLNLLFFDSIILPYLILCR
ncbi:hypothetical protein WR25_10478 isoform B [Diploscapter pachys]|nr:hypothetical protein WR25_10478 isoform B [Diploscapter pachys]